MEESLTQDNTNTTSSLLYSTTGENRLVTVLYKKVEEMERELHELKTNKILDETQLPPELLKQNNLLPTPQRRTKRGSGYRPLLRSEIEEAKRHSVFGSQQAKYLGVHVVTLRKYSILYGIWEPHPTAKGKKQPHNPDIGRYPLSKILNGDFYDNLAVDDWMVRKKLIRSGTLPECCDQCGYNRRRITDQTVSLLLDHKDGDKRNYKLENLRFLCWNCTIECGRGYHRRRIHMFDPGWRDDAK